MVFEQVPDGRLDLDVQRQTALERAWRVHGGHCALSQAQIASVEVIPKEADRWEIGGQQSQQLEA